MANLKSEAKDIAETSQSNTLLSGCKHALPPLDLSFRSLLNSEDIKEEMETHIQKNLNRDKNSTKYTCNAVRLNNNCLPELIGFADVIAEAVTDIKDISWIDLSFNHLSSIADDLLRFINLKVLYLHGNAIEKSHEVRKLARFPHLQILTIHGNPIETDAGYRQFVLSILPNLKSLDFSVVTKQDRSTAKSWILMNPRMHGKKRKRFPKPL